MYNSSIITKTLSHRFVCNTKSNTIKTISSLTPIVATNIIALGIGAFVLDFFKKKSIFS
jgi:hypothetical protein